MEVLICDTYEDLSKAAFKVMKDVLDAKPDAVLGLATGSSPVGLYQEMVKDHKENGTSYKDVKSYNLDEYVGLDRNDPQSYWTFMNENLFSGIDIDPANTHVPYGDTAEDAKAYDDEVKGVDIQLLGIHSPETPEGNGDPGQGSRQQAFQIGLQLTAQQKTEQEHKKGRIAHPAFFRTAGGFGPPGSVADTSPVTSPVCCPGNDHAQLCRVHQHFLQRPYPQAMA